MTAHPGSGTRRRAGAAGPSRSVHRRPARSDDANYYDTLGVPYTASAAEITRAYRAAMKRIHPDRQRPDRRGAAEEQAKELNQAYATLSKPLKRQAYDQSIRVEAVQDQVMSRYVGGFGGPGMGGDPHARRLRREKTPAERRAQARADRSAMASIVIVFGGITLAVVGLLVLLSLIAALFGAVF